MTQATRTSLPVHRDYTIYQGTTWNRWLKRKDANEDPIDLTDWTARMQIRRTVNGEVLFDLSSDAEGGIIISGGDGQVTWELSDEQTAGLAVKGAVYDLFMTNPAGDETYCILEGTLTIRPRVTREEPEAEPEVP